jgi:hypothetical protein
MSDIEIIADVTVSPYSIVNGSDWNRDYIMNFILGIDEEFADLDFTIALRDKLNEIIEEEQK